jgi:hypothetical protein
MKPTPPVPELAALYDALKGGMAVGAFLAAYDAIWDHIPRDFDCDLRIGKGAFKQLQEEVRPAAIFARVELSADDRIYLTLDKQDPDDGKIIRAGKILCTMQLTLSQAREHRELMAELNERKRAPGYLGLPDDAPSVDYKANLARGRIMFARDGQMKTFISGITRSLKKKGKFGGGDLLIVDAPRYHPPFERIKAALPELKLAAAESPFKRVALTWQSAKGECHVFWLKSGA